VPKQRVNLWVTATESPEVVDRRPAAADRQDFTVEAMPGG
jgi:hypothetical protein